MNVMKRKLAIVALISCIAAVKGHEMCSSVYGSEPCTFLPAAPGKTPPCAQPGSTFCEHIDHYPGDRIQYLIEKWRFDHSTILTDETRDDFGGGYVYPPPTYKYNYGNNLQQDSYFPEPIHIPKPHVISFDDAARHGVNTYIPPRIDLNFTGYPDRRQQNVNYRYSTGFSATEPESLAPQPLFPALSLPQFNAYGNRIINRKDDGFGKLLLRLRRTANVTAAQSRAKRQSPITGDPLCPARSQYITPRAALNSKGNWMYVVNMPEADNRYTQLVKSENCISQTCNGVCGLPVGYSSKCEQKYVQKRLVALEGAGNQLYTDVFWFPSCCVCTLSRS